MYSVSEAYKNAIKQPSQVHDIKGTIGGYSFTKDNILAGSFTVSNQCSGSSEVEIGQVYAGELNATFINTSVPRSSWRGLKIRPQFGIKLPDGTFEYVPLGVFTISEAVWSRTGTVVKAYDDMTLFEKSYTSDQLSGTPYSIITYACNRCGVALGMTQSEIEALPNGGESLQIYPENEIETYRCLISWIAQTMGALATINRAGELVFRTYTQIPVDEIDTEHRFTGGEVADYLTYYTGMSVVDYGSRMTNYYHVIPDDGLTYNLGSNPFLQTGSTIELLKRRRAVLLALQGIHYMPFKFSAAGDPAYDLGDVVKFTGGLVADDTISCINKYTFNFGRSYKMEGVGKSVDLATAKSKSNKDISGLLSSIDDRSIYFYDDVNAEEISIGDGEKKRIAHIVYICKEGARITFHGEYKHELVTTETAGAAVTNGDAKIKISYVVNGEEVTEYYPVDTETDGTRLLHLMYFYDSLVTSPQAVFDVYAEMEGGSMTIPAGCSRSYIMAQGIPDFDVFDPEDRELVYIEVETPPDKTEYYVGETIDYTGLVVVGIYNDGTSEVITNSCTYIPVNGSTVEYDGDS